MMDFLRSLNQKNLFLAITATCFSLLIPLFWLLIALLFGRLMHRVQYYGSVLTFIVLLILQFALWRLNWFLAKYVVAFILMGLSFYFWLWRFYVYLPVWVLVFLSVFSLWIAMLFIFSSHIDDYFRSRAHS